MNTNLFSQRLNHELTTLGLPEDTAEKSKAIAKMFGVTHYLANAMLFGNLIPKQEQLHKIAQILEVCPHWLSGSTNRKKAYPEHELAS